VWKSLPSQPVCLAQLAVRPPAPTILQLWADNPWVLVRRTIGQGRMNNPAPGWAIFRCQRLPKSSPPRSLHHNVGRAARCAAPWFSLLAMTTDVLVTCGQIEGVTFTRRPENKSSPIRLPSEHAQRREFGDRDFGESRWYTCVVSPAGFEPAFSA
jgi:hypothetical protein